MIKSVTQLTKNAIITIHDWRDDNTAILQITITNDENASLGLWISIDELIELEALIHDYVNTRLDKKDAREETRKG